MVEKDVQKKVMGNTDVMDVTTPELENSIVGLVNSKVGAVDGEGTLEEVYITGRYPHKAS